MKKQLIQYIASKLYRYRYIVYLSADGNHGFYTDGTRVVSFGGPWSTMVNFSGNYAPTIGSGTGWRLADDQTDINEDQARAYITAHAPSWAGNRNPRYTTPEQHLKTYGKSSGFVEYKPTDIVRVE
jgi:hypothetical protein